MLRKERSAIFATDLAHSNFDMADCSLYEGSRQGSFAGCCPIENLRGGHGGGNKSI